MFNYHVFVKYEVYEFFRCGVAVLLWYIYVKMNINFLSSSSQRPLNFWSEFIWLHVIAEILFDLIIIIPI